MHRRHSNRAFLTGGNGGQGWGSFTVTYLVSSLTSRYADCFLLLLFYAIKTLEGSATTVRSVRGIDVPTSEALPRTLSQTPNAPY